MVFAVTVPLPDPAADPEQYYGRRGGGGRSSGKIIININKGGYKYKG